MLTPKLAAQRKSLRGKVSTINKVTNYTNGGRYKIFGTGKNSEDEKNKNSPDNNLAQPYLDNPYTYISCLQAPSNNERSILSRVAVLLFFSKNNSTHNTSSSKVK